MGKVYLLLGGNMGDRESFLTMAEKCIHHEIGAVSGKSSIYETEPWGIDHGHNYLNQVLEIRYSADPQELLKGIQKIENKLGRIRSEHQYADRVIDIDILFYDELIYHDEKLKIPHPGIGKRKFALVPMNEVNPGFRHPVLKKTIQNLLKDCKDLKDVRKR